MEIEQNNEQGIAIFRPAGGSLTRDYYSELPDTAAAQLARGATGVILDLRRVNFIDSTGISLILDIKRKTMAVKKTFAVCFASQSLKNIFNTLNLTSVMNIFETLDQAVTACLAP